MAISLPGNLKSIKPYLEIADDYESNDPCISYWCRLYALKQGFILERVEEDLSFLLVLIDLLEKNKQDLQSKIETTDIPVARAHLEDATQKLLSWAENVPPLRSLTNVVAEVFQSAGMLQDVCSVFGNPSEGQFERKKYTNLHEENWHSELHSASTTKKSNIYHQYSKKLSENLVDGISEELQNDEAKSPKVAKHYERKKIYGRLFILQLLNHPVSQKKPEGLPSLEIVRNKMGRNQIIADRLLGVHQQQYQLRTNFNPKKICLIYKIVRKDREEQKMELNNPLSQEPSSPLGGRSRSSDYRWNSDQNSSSRGGSKERWIPKASRDADQIGGKGVTSWRRVASSDTAQSLIGGVGGCKQKMNSGFFGLRSQPPSCENSVTRPVFRETARPSTLSREDVFFGKSTVTDEQIERKSRSILGEYFTNEKIEDAVFNMKEWLHPSTIARFINQCLLHVLKHNKQERRATGALLKEMVKRKLFNSSDLVEGFTELFQSAEDFIVDIPKLWEYLAELVEPLFEEGVMNLKFLSKLSLTLSSSLVVNFVAAVLKELVRVQGVTGAERILIMSNAPLTSVLPSSVDLNSFLAQHTELEFLSKIHSTPRGSGSVGNSISSATPASQVNIEFQHSLEKYLRDATQLTTDNICSWIQKQYVGEVNSAFVRALVTAVTENAIEGRGLDSKLNDTALKNRTEVLRRYVDNIAYRELQLLYAVQALVTQRKHPKGLLQGICEILYDSNVVSEEGFESWVSVDDPLEREGKAVALKMITSFLTWLKEADPESDQEEDAWPY
ncbi:eukaryotic translation initiation factor 4 gamma 3-like isoform X2 [Daphnia pulicaria]|uniref:eukaryotic translation initiation factor 4 gamma 3-like isoform X2 n=1 Tax=Daphnia pulicaria TaxID=35523 RepID=UPI001EEBC32B|nr:eukaryotic translation initiation factor 4 gamma 3-like isoform X2 [Daphnia pulicaria]